MEWFICYTTQGVEAQSQFLRFPEGDLFRTDWEGALSRKILQAFPGKANIVHSVKSLSSNRRKKNVLAKPPAQEVL